MTLQVYVTAEAALAQGQTELEHRLKPPKDLQDALSQAKASLSPPPGPVQQALDAFADGALGKLSAPPHFLPLVPINKSPIARSSASASISARSLMSLKCRSSCG
jgi:hypothetical protein